MPQYQKVYYNLINQDININEKYFFINIFYIY